MSMTDAEQRIEDDKMRAEIAHLAAQTRKLNKEIRWYEAVIFTAGVSGLTLAIVAITKTLL